MTATTSRRKISRPPEKKPDAERYEKLHWNSSERFSRWAALLEAVPEIKGILPKTVNEPVPPYPIGDALFLSLCAAFADKKKRPILRALILELLTDDLVELLSIQKNHRR